MVLVRVRVWCCSRSPRSADPDVTPSHMDSPLPARCGDIAVRRRPARERGRCNTFHSYEDGVRGSAHGEDTQTQAGVEKMSARPQTRITSLSRLPAKEETMLSFRRIYMFSYNLFQFCGHTWILANTIARVLWFGQDALADTFYSVGFVMSLCQLLSVLELFHIADGLEKARLLPRFVQVVEKNLLLLMVITLEEMQSKPVVCVQLFLWNVLDLLRYPHELLCVLDELPTATLWPRYTLWIPVYILSVINEGVTIYQALPHTESLASNSPHVRLPLLLVVYLHVLALGASVTVWQLLKERQHHLDKWSKKMKRK